MKKNYFLILFAGFITHAFSQTETVNLDIHVQHELGELKPIWAWFGYDEPNYTYMKDGKKLLRDIQGLSPVPVYVRAHNLMTTGDGTPALKWGSTNMYTEDEKGKAIYNWKIVDSIFDTYINLGMKPLAQIGFMPKALSTNPEPYQHAWEPGVRYDRVYTGWAYPPNNYEKWAELIYQWVIHCVERYGKEEVESWYWELWNEPDIGYLQAENSLKTYCKMYDYASHAVKRALPTAIMGGPHSTGGAAKFLEGFIKHCLSETNAITGKTGAPLDFVAFHAKGSPRVVDGKVRMGMMNQLQNINSNLKVIASFPEIKKLPVIIGESDPEGCAACGMHTNPENAYRNGTLYSSYTAASLARIYDLNDHYGTNLMGAVNWSFEFENQPWFQGFRDLATNGINKPVLNVFKMMGMMSGERLEVNGNTAYNYKNILEQSVRGNLTDVNALAAIDQNKITVLLWNYHDLDITEGSSRVKVNLTGLKDGKAALKHYRIDTKHSNSYTAWKEMGSPQQPTAEQYKKLEQASELQMVDKVQMVKIKDEKLHIEFELPRQGVSLLYITY